MLLEIHRDNSDGLPQRLCAYTRWVTKFEAGQKMFLHQQIQDEVGHDESVIPKATQRILGPEIRPASCLAPGNWRLKS